MTRAALYLRVSTEDQTEENQAPELRQLAARRGWEPVEYRETMSGAAKVRPVLERMLADVRAGKVGAVVVWALDRLSRQGAGPVLNMVGELDRCGVALVSVREPWLDTSGPFRDVIVAFAATMAKMERARLIERTRAGIDRARREGKALGRPRVPPLDLAAAARLVADGVPVREAARRTTYRDVHGRMRTLGEGTLRRHLSQPAEV
jgi:putative DNA-invertase from lambdoid prophage Rac